MTFVIKSPAFANGQAIPTKYTRDGENIPPPLEWRGAPDGTRSYVLLVEDPDAPSATFRHWAVYNIAASQESWPEGMTIGAHPESLGHGVNDFGHAGYDGPEPPKGHGPHHYHFRLAALDAPALDLPADAKAAEVWRMAGEHILATTETVGTYQRWPVDDDQQR